MNTLDFTKLKVGNYNRKSSESEDKQMLSIQSQVDEADRIAEYYKLKPFVEIFKESKSAKTEGVRPEFTKMVIMIRKGEIDAIVCWKADRLARNMEEGGQIIDLLSSGTLKAIITHDKVFYPWDNVMLLSIEFSQGKQFVKELSINVKRGQEKKARMGIPHGIASLGFLNDKTEEKGNRKWLVDKIRLAKIKILLDMFLTGTYSAGKLHRYAINELKLTTVTRKREGGGLITPSRMYELLKDPIYAGFFFQVGTRYEFDKNMPRLITEAEHNKIKQILSRKNIPKSQHHEAVYSGFIQSDEGNFMGPDVKFQVICDCKKKFAYRNKTQCPKCDTSLDQMEHPKYLDYTHYYNVKKKKSSLPYKSISEKDITKEMVKYIGENLNFSNDLLEWSKKYIHEMKDREVSEKVLMSKDRENRKEEYELKKSKLRGMLRDEKIIDSEYEIDLSSLNKQYADTSTTKVEINWYQEMIEITDLTQGVIEVMQNGSFQSKRNILSKLGSNLVWNDKELNIYNKKSINTLVNGIKTLKMIYPKFEPSLSFTEQGLNEKTSEFTPVFSTLLSG